VGWGGVIEKGKGGRSMEIGGRASGRILCGEETLAITFNWEKRAAAAH